MIWGYPYCWKHLYGLVPNHKPGSNPIWRTTGVKMQLSIKMQSSGFLRVAENIQNKKHIFLLLDTSHIFTYLRSHSDLLNSVSFSLPSSHSGRCRKGTKEAVRSVVCLFPAKSERILSAFPQIVVFGWTFALFLRIAAFFAGTLIDSYWMKTPHFPTANKADHVPNWDRFQLFCAAALPGRRNSDAGRSCEREQWHVGFRFLVQSNPNILSPIESIHIICDNCFVYLCSYYIYIYNFHHFQHLVTMINFFDIHSRTNIHKLKPGLVEMGEVGCLDVWF